MARKVRVRAEVMQVRMMMTQASRIKSRWGDGWKRTIGKTDGPTNTTLNVLQSRMGREEEEREEVVWGWVRR